MNDFSPDPELERELKTIAPARPSQNLQRLINLHLADDARLEEALAALRPAAPSPALRHSLDEILLSPDRALEEALAALRPAAPSPALRHSLDEILRQPRRPALTPVRRFYWAAAAALLALIPLHMAFQAHQHDKDALAVSPDSQGTAAQIQPASVQRPAPVYVGHAVRSSQYQGRTLNGDGYVLQTVLLDQQQTAIISTADGRTISQQQPSRRVVLIPRELD